MQEIFLISEFSAPVKGVELLSESSFFHAEIRSRFGAALCPQHRNLRFYPID
jgi:hypothetical protein